ncbi:MAG: REP-associated tyrosine transposase [Limisphaerales bacterium]
MAYLWRRLTPEQRASLLAWRKQRSFPWHSPPHAFGAAGTYHLTGACLDHVPHVGRSPERMVGFCDALLAALASVSSSIHAWCVLPNHYHLLVSMPDLRAAVRALGRLHGSTSFKWNKEENARGRQVWHAASDRFMRGERHFWATMNYIHHNPVRHGYVEHWQEWPYSSAREFLIGLSREEAARIWRDYPLEDYGKGWDEPWM